MWQCPKTVPAPRCQSFAWHAPRPAAGRGCGPGGMAVSCYPVCTNAAVCSVYRTSRAPSTWSHGGGERERSGKEKGKDRVWGPCWTSQPCKAGASQANYKAGLACSTRAARCTHARTRTHACTLLHLPPWRETLTGRLQAALLAAAAAASAGFVRRRGGVLHSDRSVCPGACLIRQRGRG